MCPRGLRQLGRLTLRILPFTFATLLIMAAIPMAAAQDRSVEFDPEEVGSSRLAAPEDARDRTPPELGDEPERNGRRFYADGAVAGAGTTGDGVLMGSLTFDGVPLEGIEIEFWNPAADESYFLTTDDDGKFIASVPAGRYYVSWWSIEHDPFYLQEALRPKVVAGKTTNLALTAGSYEPAMLFTWPASTDEEFFTVYFFEEGTEFENEPLHWCEVFIEDGQMECTVPSVGFAAFFVDEADEYDLYIVPEDSDEFILYGAQAYAWPYAVVPIYFEDTLGGIEIDVGSAAEDRYEDVGYFEYSFKLYVGKANVGGCSVEIGYDYDWSYCWGSGIRSDGDGFEFLLPAGTYSMVLYSPGAKDITIKKVVVKADAWTSVTSNFVPNSVTVSVTGTGAADSVVALTVYNAWNGLNYLSWAGVENGVATFRWVPAGTVVAEGHSDISTYGDTEKAFTGGTLRLKVALK